MPVSKGAPPPEPDVTATPETPADAGVSSSPDTVPPPGGLLPAGVYEYTPPFKSVYLAVPLTARPAFPGAPAQGDQAALPPSPATVFDWAGGAPADGRWAPTTRKPNQAADNAAPLEV